MTSTNAVVATTRVQRDATLWRSFATVTAQVPQARHKHTTRAVNALRTSTCTATGKYMSTRGALHDHASISGGAPSHVPVRPRAGTGPICALCRAVLLRCHRADAVPRHRHTACVATRVARTETVHTVVRDTGTLWRDCVATLLRRCTGATWMHSTPHRHASSSSPPPLCTLSVPNRARIAVRRERADAIRCCSASLSPLSTSRKCPVCASRCSARGFCGE